MGSNLLDFSIRNEGFNSIDHRPAIEPRLEREERMGAAAG